MLTLQLESCDGGRFQLPALLEWEVTRTGGVPCDSIYALCAYDPGMAQALPRAARFTALRDGTLMLRGVVDAYEIRLTEKGLTLAVEGRGMAALLLDNESEAVSYERATLAEVLKNHAAPYGLTADIRQTPAAGGYTVPAGSSQWKALQGYTRRFGGFDPYFTGDGTLVAGPLWGSGKRLRVDGGTPVLSLVKREERYGVISEVLIQDKVQGVSHRVVNEPFAAAGGQRRQVLYMPRSTPDTRRWTGEYQIAQSALEQIELSLTLPWAFAAEPGDQAELALDRLGLASVYDVVEVRSCGDENGERTELTLSVR